MERGMNWNNNDLRMVITKKDKEIIQIKLKLVNMKHKGKYNKTNQYIYIYILSAYRKRAVAYVGSIHQRTFIKGKLIQTIDSSNKNKYKTTNNRI